MARRVIVVVSPDSLTWSNPFFSQTLNKLSTLTTRTMIITLKKPPSLPKCSVRGRVDSNASVDLSTGLETLCWGDRQFWLRLRYAMPPMRRGRPEAQNVAMIVQQGNNNQGPRSRESLEVLV